MKTKILLFLFICVALIGVVTSLSINTFPPTAFNITYSVAGSNISYINNIPKNSTITLATMDLNGIDNTNNVIGNGNLGELIFTTGTKIYGSMIEGTDYNVSGNTLYLKLNKEYNFTNITIGPGTIISTLNITGTLLILRSTNKINISGMINLSNTSSIGTISDSYTIDGLTLTSPSVTNGGNGGNGANGPDGTGTGGSQGNGYGGGGGGGACNINNGHGGNGGTGGTPGGTGGAAKVGVNGIGQIGNVGGTSAGGSGGTAYGTPSSGKGGDSYSEIGGNGADGGAQANRASAGGGGGGGKPGIQGINIVFKSNDLYISGTIDISGTKGTDGGNGGNEFKTGTIDCSGGGGGGAGGSGNAGNIYLNVLNTNSITGTIIQTGGTKAIGGTKGTGAYGTTYNGNNGTVGSDGIITNITSNLVNLTIDIGDDGIIDNNYSEINYNNTINLNTTIINNWLQNNCSTSPCNLPLNISSSSIGILQLSNLNLNYMFPPPFILNLSANNNSIFPQIGDTIILSSQVYDNYTIANCSLFVNTTGTYTSVNTEIINVSTYYLTSQNYTIPTTATKNNSVIGYKFECFDFSGSSNFSELSSFKVQDVTYPVGHASLNNFLGNFTSNNTIISGLGRDTSYLNYTFSDYNLFAIEVLINCSINNSLYYFNITNLNQSNYTLTALLNMTGQKNQVCSGQMAWADDHTTIEIENYKSKDIDNGMEFSTPETRTNIDIKSLDDDFVDMNSKKLIDRKTFDATYSEKLLYRSFIIPKPEGITLYTRVNSRYPGHIVAWNESAFNGNWIDFKVKDRDDLIYETAQLDNGDVQVTISVDLSKHLVSNQNIPSDLTPNDNDIVDIEALNQRVITDIKNNDERMLLPDATPWYTKIFGAQNTIDENIIENYGIDELQFETIGGVLVTYLNFTYVMGGDVNTTMYNEYDNTTDNIHTYNLTVTNTTLLSYPFSITNYSHGNMSGLPNGTYLFQFNSSYYFPRNYTVLVENFSQVLNYSSCQAGANFLIKPVNSATYLTNFTVFINNTNTSNYLNYTAFGLNTTLSLCLNASNYTYGITHPSYVGVSVNGSFSLSHLDNLTIDSKMPFNGSFLLLDEKTESAFNMSSPNEIKFWLFCTNDTNYVTTVKNSTGVNVSNVFTTLINCDYKYFRFTLDWGTDNYYRTFILTPVQVNNYNIYLIDLATTTSVSTSFIVDDLLTNYNNASLWAYKVFTNGTNQISADYIDVEAKVTYFLIENNEYSIELHSSNQPIVYYGNYVANTAGTKKLTTYTISMNVSSTAFSSNVNYGVSTAYDNSTNVTAEYYTAYYKDTSNSTSNVTFTVYQSSLSGPVLYTQSNSTDLVNGISYIIPQNTTNPTNTTVILQLCSTYSGVNYCTTKKVFATELPKFSEVKAYMGREFMNWLFLIFMSVLVLLSTITTGPTIALVVCGFAILMKTLGWTTISFIVLILAALVAWISFMKKGEQEI